MWTKRMRFGATLLLSLTLNSGCATIGAHRDFCKLAQPVYVRDGDMLTRATAQEILYLDQTGAALCSWKPASKAESNPGR
jgi:hypothetical protein